MRTSFAGIARAICVAFLVSVGDARGGDFTWVQGSDTVSVDPLRIRIRFGLYNAHYFDVMCRLRLLQRLAAAPCPGLHFAVATDVSGQPDR